MSTKIKPFPSNSPSSIRLASSMPSASNHSSAPDTPTKVSIATPIKLNSTPQFVTLPHTYTNATEMLNPPPLNPYTTNEYSETSEGFQCLHSDCHINCNNDTTMEEGPFIMSVNTLNPPIITAENPDPTLVALSNNNLHIDSFNNTHFSMQVMPETLAHNQHQPLLTTLLPPSTPINPNDVIMSSSTSYSLLRSVSPVNNLPGLLVPTNSPQIFNDTIEDCNNEKRKSYVSGNFNSLRSEEAISMRNSIENNNQCSTLLL